ncbi:MAG: TIGR03087 family PEP-CTERM/XrtA system glycosyltransferase [Gammaproteobacteria bacterium]|nr:TIGR03087 family PEP-CTERM/XrtA system glycosyltransferase [Gammaproteobacteria bacterium]
MENVLFLVHRVPYPPNKGDKIRSFHTLKYLARRYNVYLGAFADDAEDLNHLEALKPYCADIRILPLDKRVGYVRALRALATREALGVGFYRDRRMQSWVASVLGQHQFKAAICFSSTMATYLDQAPSGATLKIADLVDMDSEKWRQYAGERRFPMSMIYAREARLLRELEARVANEFDRCVLVSPDEARLLLPDVRTGGERVVSIVNGVDTEFFDPRHDLDSPYAEGEKALVFTGAMDYWPNVDAVVWFANEVFPEIRRRTGASFHVVGDKATEAVLALAGIDGVHVEGRVDDIRPWIRHAAAAVAPLRIARGLQNKVLEAMAMARVTLLTPEAAEGISGGGLPGFKVCAAPADFYAAADAALGEGNTQAEESREFVQEHFSWQLFEQEWDRLLA